MNIICPFRIAISGDVTLETILLFARKCLQIMYLIYAYAGFGMR